MNAGSGLVTLTAGDDVVAIDLANGGRLGSWRAGGRERLKPRPGSASGGAALQWGSYLMAPWAGRLRDGLLRFAGRTYRFEPNLGAHAIHGLCFDRPWTVERSSETELELGFDLEATPWPFGGGIEQMVRLGPGELRLRAELLCTRAAMPAAMGWHPWFLRGPGEDVLLRVPADEMLVAEGELLPTGERRPASGPTDLRTIRPVEGLTLDDAYVGAREAELRWPDLELEIAAGPTVTTIVVYVSEGSVCVEPQTAWPDAPTLAAAGFTDTGLAILEPGQALVAEQTWRWRSQTPS